MDFEGIFFNTYDYEIDEKIIGKGTFGEVHIATNVNDHQKYAIKLIKTNSDFNGEEQMNFMRESMILHKFSHPSILKFIGINFQSIEDQNILQPSIITEYLSNGSLYQVLLEEKKGKNDPKWNSTKKFKCLLGIVDALRYLHRQGVLHLDLKPLNILLDDDFNPKICDFGLSRCIPQSFTKSVQMTIKNLGGSPLYMAPEILQGETHFGYAVDVYAFGLIAYQIATGYEPFFEFGENINIFVIMKAISSNFEHKFPEKFPKNMKKLILKCLKKKPEERPTFDEIFSVIEKDLSLLGQNVDVEEINSYILQLKSVSYDMNFSFQEKKQEKERKCYSDVIQKLLPLISNFDKIQESGNQTILHSLCESGNIDLVKYIISLNKFDINVKTIPITNYLLMMFHIYILYNFFILNFYGIFYVFIFIKQSFILPVK